MKLTIAFLAVHSLLAQQTGSPPVPLWDGQGSLSQEMNQQFVFLSPDRHTVLIRLPQGAPDQPFQIIRVPLHNNFRASLTHQVTRESAREYRYEYQLSNDARSNDRIGVLSLIVRAPDSSLQVPHGQPPESQWAGAPAYAAVARQYLFPEFPAGQHVLWVRQRGQELVPGASLHPLVVQSNLRPGLSTAWASSIEAPAFDPRWPREVYQQLEKLEDRQWREQLLVTVAPTFAPDAPTKEILQHLQAGLSALRIGNWIQPQSAFIRQVEGLIAHGLTQRMSDLANPRTFAQPQSEVERAIATVLRLSLGVPIP